MDVFRQPQEETEMIIATMLLDRKLNVNAWKELPGVRSRGDPGALAINATRQARTGRARNMYHRFATFFKIGRGYNWAEQYREYSEHWRNYFQARPPVQ